MKYLMKQYGLTLYPQYEEGKFVMGLDHKNYLYLDSMGHYFNQHKDKINQLLSAIATCTKQLEDFSNRKANGTLGEAGQRDYAAFVEKYDSLSALDFIRQIIKDEHLSLLLANEIQTLECVSCEKITAVQLFCDEEKSSLANVRFYIGAQGANIDGFRVQEGVTELLNRMKAQVQKILDSKGKGQKFSDMVRLSTPVEEVLNHQSPVIVKTSTGETYSCEKAIICLPVATMGRIKFSSLSTGKKLLVENQLTCNMTRMAMVFARPWWRPKHCGYVSFSHKFPMNELVELTPKEETIGILAFVFTGDGFEEWDRQVREECGQLKGEALRRKWYEVNRRKCMQIVADLYLNGDVNHENLKEVAIFAKSLSKSPYIRSTYQAATAPGVYSSIVKNGEDCWAAPQSEEKNLVVLGSDFSDEFAGYMEGAIRHARKKIYALCKAADPLDYLRKQK